MGMKETLIEILKDLVLPELDALKGQIGKLEVRLAAVEQRLEDFNSRFQGIDQHLVDQSRRIDETNGRIDKLNTDLVARIDKVNADLTARIDQQILRIDGLTAQLAALAQGLGELRHDREVMGDVFCLAQLEAKVAA
jgi:chromosome segregation ATPase